MSPSAFGYAIALILLAAVALGAYFAALGRRADEARKRALEALGVGLVVGRAAGGRAASRRSARGTPAPTRLGGTAAALRLLGLDAGGRGREADARLASALGGQGDLSALLAAGEGRAEFFSGEGGERRRIEARALPLGRLKKEIVLVLSDITATASLLEELSTLASMDALTGIFNRRRFDEQGERDIELARRSLASVGVIMLDIDLFKRVNDERGHSVGDEALKAVALACKDALRSSDIIGRYGGEEFAVLLPGSGAAESLAVAERLRERVAAIALPCQDGTVSVTISLGAYSGVPSPDEDLALYLRRADEALYRSKALGRNRASYWKPL
jgi:diguanylate cyclase (GGDEF)-like protein